MQVMEVMKTHVVKTSPEATLSQAVDLMDLYQVNCLPVVEEDGRLCGIISEADVLRAALPDGVEAESAEPWTEARRGAAEYAVRDYMTVPPVSVSESLDLREASALLLTRNLKRLPVLSEEGQVVGTLNRIDVLQALFEGHL